ncbi:MAG: hypothetical protein QOG84_2005 [Sphingomonadales bacterium]|jgi:TonB family protein|nr:hypothetical protein [Sphingomonadales bacterium]
MIRPFRAAAFAALLLATAEAPPPAAPAPPPVSRGALAQLFGEADYPADALRRHEQGKVGFHLDIDAAGGVAGCTITQSSGSASLDEATCRLIKARARFSPVRDAGGKAVPDTFDGHIVWHLDDDTAPAPPPGSSLATLFSDADYPMAALRRHEQGKVDFRLDIDSAGGVTGCTVTHSSGSVSLDEATCRLLKERAHFSPARDAAGNAVPDTFDGHIIWRIDDDTSASPEFDAAAGVWMRCLTEAVRQRVAGPEAAETLVAKAFDACTAEEAQLAAIGTRTLAQPAPDSNAMRQGMREALLQSISTARSKPSR